MSVGGVLSPISTLFFDRNIGRTDSCIINKSLHRCTLKRPTTWWITSLVNSTSELQTLLYPHHKINVCFSWICRATNARTVCTKKSHVPPLRTRYKINMVCDFYCDTRSTAKFCLFQAAKRSAFFAVRKVEHALGRKQMIK